MCWLFGRRARTRTRTHQHIATRTENVLFQLYDFSNRTRIMTSCGVFVEPAPVGDSSSAFRIRSVFGRALLLWCASNHARTHCADIGGYSLLSNPGRIVIRLNPMAQMAVGMWPMHIGRKSVCHRKLNVAFYALVFCTSEIDKRYDLPFSIRLSIARQHQIFISHVLDV